MKVSIKEMTPDKCEMYMHHFFMFLLYLFCPLYAIYSSTLPNETDAKMQVYLVSVMLLWFSITFVMIYNVMRK